MKTQNDKLLVDALVLATLMFSLSSSGAATLTHNYELNGDLADSLGGPSLVEVIDTDLGAPNVSGIRPTGFEFSSDDIPYVSVWGHGLSLQWGLSPDNYSIEMFFRLEIDRVWMKLIDFYDRGQPPCDNNGLNPGLFESGLYVRTDLINPPLTAGTLQFYYGWGELEPDFFIPSHMVHLVVTRASDGQFDAYVNGAPTLLTWNFSQPPYHEVNDQMTTFSRGIAHFFNDERYCDAVGNQADESCNGFVDFIRIYDGPLTAAEVQARYSATVDQTPPTIGPCVNVTGNATSPAGAVVTYPAPPASDNIAVASVTCVPASGSIFPIGTTRVTCTATDTSGNSASCEFDIVVLGAGEQIANAISLAESLPLKPSTANSLLTKLHDASTLLGQGNATGACGKLKDFIAAVQAQAGKKQISLEQAAWLIAEATRIQAVLACK